MSFPKSVLCACSLLLFILVVWTATIVKSLNQLDQIASEFSNHGPIVGINSDVDRLVGSIERNIVSTSRSYLRYSNDISVNKKTKAMSVALGEEEDPIGRLSAHPLHSIVYGSPLVGKFRTPLVMINLKLDETLHDYFIAKEQMFSCNQSELDNIKTLDNRVKLPVYIYEGYYHSMPVADDIYSRNPNPLIGVDFMKPAATASLRSFFIAFRRVNRNIFEPLQEALFSSSRKRCPTNPEQDICYFLASWIKQGKVFGDLSVQIHYGEGNDKRFGQGWHVDAENSLLHLAVTFRGSRILHSKRCREDHGLADEILEPQHAGDVYLTSSALMVHAPKFFSTSFEDRVIAVHARILYTTAELQQFRKYKTEESWTSLTSILAEHLSRADVKLPNLRQVQMIANKL